MSSGIEMGTPPPKKDEVPVYDVFRIYHSGWKKSQSEDFLAQVRGSESAVTNYFNYWNMMQFMTGHRFGGDAGMSLIEVRKAVPKDGKEAQLVNEDSLAKIEADHRVLVEILKRHETPMGLRLSKEDDRKLTRPRKRRKRLDEFKVYDVFRTYDAGWKRSLNEDFLGQVQGGEKEIQEYHSYWNMMQFMTGHKTGGLTNKSQMELRECHDPKGKVPMVDETTVINMRTDHEMVVKILKEHAVPIGLSPKKIIRYGYGFYFVC